MRLPEELRQRHYYTVDVAGAMIGWSRASSFRRAHAGDFPLVRDGRFLLVPKQKWDRIVRRIMREERPLNFGLAAEPEKSLGG
ncbi:hypothetical protein ACE10X_21320 [Bradyrhizobium sp. Pha-3]|uniref:hypothetical protein n=1 Tax=Bradyrhizobium sp. Pha-3 TaxID=208375 RepID=UPI0035D40030